MSDLKRVVAMGELLVARKEALDAAEQQAKELKAEVLRLEREDLPMLMQEIGVSNITLTSGQTITVKEDLDTKITEKNRPAAFGWLLKNGFGGIIKTSVALSFDRGDREKAAAIAAELAERYPEREVALDENVHPSTLKAFVKERMSAGDPIPGDLFGIYVYNKAVIKG